MRQAAARGHARAEPLRGRALASGVGHTVRIALTLIAWLALASTAHAQGVLDKASDSLALNPVYVDPDAQQAISEDDAEALRTEIADREAGPLYIAVLPASAANEAGGDPGAALAEIAEGWASPAPMPL